VINKEGVQMKKSDLILIIGLVFLSIGSIFLVRYLQAGAEMEEGIAVVVYQNQEVIRIELSTNDYQIIQPNYVIDINEEENIYTLVGTLGNVYIQVQEGKVSVIDETSPQNICQIQGETNSSLKPLTCLPNDLVVRIEAPLSEDDDDIIVY